MEDSLVYQIYKLLSSNRINVDRQELDFQIKSHPTYPSLHAITGVLDHFNIDNLALNVPVNEEILRQLPKTYLARVHTPEGEDFALVVEKTRGYELLFSKKKKSTLTIEKFLNIFTGIIVAVEKSEHTKTSKASSIKYGSILIGTAILLGFITFVLSSPSLGISLYFILSLIGVFISISILKQELGFQNLLGDAICSDTTDKTDCNAVLTSDGAQIVGPFKLSDLSIIYFTSLSILSFLPPLQQSTSTLLIYI